MTNFLNKFLNRRVFFIVIFIVIFVSATGGAFYFGYQKGTENPKTVVIKGVGSIEEGRPESVDFGIFWDVWQVVKDKYVEADKLENQKLVYGAIDGLLGALDDPNSIFFPPDDAKKFNEDISGEFFGIGAEIGIRQNQLIIIAPLKESPTEKAGLRSKDKILKIDDKSTEGISVDEAVKLIRGEKGTKVILTIIRDEWDKPKEITIIRDVIKIPTIDWEMKDNGIAYIQLYNFYEQAPFLFYKAAVDVALKNPKGMVLDLRNNPGGYLDVSVHLAGWFLKPGEIVVSEEFRLGEKEIFKAAGNGFFQNLPVVILVNEGSASASEILAGALRDNRGVKLVGKKTFGKGTVQELQQLKSDSMIKITVAHWRLPNGQLIEKNGLDPDYEVDLTDEDIESERDPQLEKAMEILKSQIIF